MRASLQLAYFYITHARARQLYVRVCIVYTINHVDIMCYIMLLLPLNNNIILYIDTQNIILYTTLLLCTLHSDVLIIPVSYFFHIQLSAPISPLLKNYVLCHRKLDVSYRLETLCFQPIMLLCYVIYVKIGDNSDNRCQ